MPPSISSRTGTRWTILTQLPEAFCGGNRESSAPVEGLMLATFARQERSG